MAMTSEITYLGDLRTRATHIASGQTLETDAPVDNQGRGSAFSPTDLCATSLASCLLTIMGIKARDAGIDMTGTTIRLLKVMSADPPRRIDRIEMHMHMPARDYTSDQKAVLTQASASCPVCRSLSASIETRLEIIWA